MTAKFVDQLLDDVRTSPTCTVTGIVEMSRLEPAKRDELVLRHEGEAWPLMSQPEFGNVRMIGPWLFGPGTQTSLNGQYDRYCILNRQAPDAVCGWITSELAPAQLALHLSQASVAYAPDGERYLLRFHTEAALPVLHARRAQPGLRELFAPITSWWFPLPHASQQQWAVVRGERAQSASAIPPIMLDDSAWEALAVDSLAYALADQLKSTLVARQPETDCYGTRLGIVQRHLAQARQQGLERSGDLADYVTLMVQQDHTLNTDTDWQAAINEAKGGGVSLARAYRNLRFKA